MHDIVINDNGQPELKKRGVYTTGCSQVLKPEEREAIFNKISINSTSIKNNSNLQVNKNQLKTFSDFEQNI